MRLGTFRALCVLPLTAILHHVVFYRPQCIFSPIEDVGLWLLRDPSLPYAALVVVALWGIVTEDLARRFFLAFLPLTVWLWDIPFTGRFVHRTMHDGRWQVGGVVVHTHHVYVLCALLFVGSFIPRLLPRVFLGPSARGAPRA
jgi:hypothetical protein